MLQISEQDLTPFNTLGLHAQAQALLRYQLPEQLPALSDAAARYPRLFVLGGGSNVVLPSAVGGLVVKVESRGIANWGQADGQLIIEAHAGETWHDFVAACIDLGWNGLENLALIPGTVGAAPVQNIGAYGVELDQRFHSLVAWDIHKGHAVEMGPADCGFSYRNSFFKQAEPGRWLIVKVRFGLPLQWQPVLGYPDLQRHPVLEKAGSAATARQIFDAVCEIRKQKLPDPAVLGNAGSFFKNPIVTADTLAVIRQNYPGVVAYAQDGGLYKLAAGWLIDQAGWKGRRMGPVGVHDRQALVLVNHGGATAHDIKALADAIRTDIRQRFGVSLEQEPIAVEMPD